MTVNKPFWLALSVVFGATLASANITYTCDPTVDAKVAGTCVTLNSSIAGLYNSTFNNATADIYIKYGTTGLGESTQGFTNQLSYAAYRADLAATESGSALDTAALASLPLAEPAIYGGAPVDISSALGTALGLSNLNGTTAAGAICTIGTAGCYNGIITITNDPGTPLFYRNGVQPADAYDFYSVAEHETDEVLGTSSCIDTTGGALSNGCTNNAPAAVDLFRYNAGSRVFMDTTPGAYFSFNGGVTNGAAGAPYNTLANGDDYADFTTNCAHIQDATGCLGGSLDITSDGFAEINTLDAIGYNRSTSAVPEPNMMGLLGMCFAVIAAFRYKRRGNSTSYPG